MDSMQLQKNHFKNHFKNHLENHFESLLSNYLQPLCTQSATKTSREPAPGNRGSTNEKQRGTETVVGCRSRALIGQCRPFATRLPEQRKVHIRTGLNFLFIREES